MARNHMVWVNGISTFAADPHFGVRELAWMAMRADIDIYLVESIWILVNFTASEDENIRLTEKEAPLLRYFYLNKNRLIKREEVLLQIWKSDDYFSGRSLDVFVSKLRKYLIEDDQIVIETVPGAGFECKLNEV